VLLHDVELLFEDLVGDIQRVTPASGAGVGPESVSLGLEVRRQSLSAGGLRGPRRALRLLRLRWRLPPIVESGLGSTVADRKNRGTFR